MHNDNVNHPSHYIQGNIECIDAIHSVLGEEGFKAYCTGNVLKYVWRWQHKGGNEDLSKAAWYITKILKENP